MLQFVRSMLQEFSSSTSSTISSSVTSSGISAFFSEFGSLERTSAIVVWWPGRYTVMEVTVGFCAFPTVAGKFALDLISMYLDQKAL